MTLTEIKSEISAMQESVVIGGFKNPLLLVSPKEIFLSGWIGNAYVSEQGKTLEEVCSQVRKKLPNSLERAAVLREQAAKLFQEAEVIEAKAMEGKS